MIRIVIADDELPIREWLKYCLKDKEDRFQIVGEASDGLMAYDLIRTLKPDVVITDIRMPKMSGTVLMEQISEILPQTDVVVLTNHADFSYARQAVSCGAKEYILKSELRSSELIAILEEIYEEHHRIKDKENVRPREFEDKRKFLEDIDLHTGGHESVEKALSFIHEHYEDNISLVDVAGYVYRSPAYFSRLFKEVTGENFSIYLIQYRLKMAARLLKETDLKITDISYRVGYQNPSYFSRLYKKHMGCTPEEERKKIGAKKVL